MTIIRTKRRGLRRLGGFNKARGRGREQGIRGFRTRVPWLWGWREEGAGRATPTSVSGFPATSGNEKGVHFVCAMRWGSGLLVFLFVFFCLWTSVFPRAICGTDRLFPTDSPSAFLKDQPARVRATSGLCVLERRVRPLSRGTRY